jgi:hypothetical protein
MVNLEGWPNAVYRSGDDALVYLSDLAFLNCARLILPPEPYMCLRQQVRQVRQIPDVIRDASFHRRRYP